MNKQKEETLFVDVCDCKLYEYQSALLPNPIGGWTERKVQGKSLWHEYKHVNVPFIYTNMGG